MNKNIYTVLENINFEDKCKKAERFRTVKEWDLKQFTFSIVQAFYEQLLKEEPEVPEEPQADPINHCLTCNEWHEKEKVCAYDECSECECLYLHQKGWMEDENGYVPQDWNPDYKWDRKLSDLTTEGNK